MNREFQKWAKAHGITFKRSRDERAALEVWKACKEDENSKYAPLLDELVAIGDLLDDAGDDIAPVIDVQKPDFSDRVAIINPKSYGA